MANPFSGLENIGQSYLQGVQLANQRQYREEAAAQRAEDTRVRQQYYTQMGADREAALKDRRQARFDAAASQLGQDLVLDAQGEPDIPRSALKRDRRLQSDTLAAAEGELDALYGTQRPLSPDIIASPSYQAGRIKGTARKMTDERAENVALIRRGYIPVGQSGRQLPVDVENQIDAFSPDIFDGGGEPLTEAPMGAGAPSGGGQLVTISGQQYRVPAARAVKTEKSGTMKFTTPSGQEISVNISPEKANQLLATQLASADKEPGDFDDIDAAEKELKRLASRGKNADVNVYEDDQGNVKVRKEQTGSIGESYGYTIEEAKAQLEVKRKDRKQALGITSSEPAPKNRAEAASRARRVTPSSGLRNVPPITQRVPATTSTNAPVAVAQRLPVDSLAPASPYSSESLGIDADELRQAMSEYNGIDPTVLGLQLRRSLNEAGVRTNSLPLELSQEQLDAILRLPRGRAPVEL